MSSCHSGSDPYPYISIRELQYLLRIIACFFVHCLHSGKYLLLERLTAEVFSHNFCKLDAGISRKLASALMLSTPDPLEFDMSSSLRRRYATLVSFQVCSKKLFLKAHIQQKCSNFDILTQVVRFTIPLHHGLGCQKGTQ